MLQFSINTVILVWDSCFQSVCVCICPYQINHTTKTNLSVRNQGQTATRNLIMLLYTFLSYFHVSVFEQAVYQDGESVGEPNSESHGAKSTRDSEQDQCLFRRTVDTWRLWWQLFSPLCQIQTRAWTWERLKLRSWLHKTDCPDHRSLFKHSSPHLSSSSSIITNTWCAHQHFLHPHWLSFYILVKGSVFSGIFQTA